MRTITIAYINISKGNLDQGHYHKGCWLGAEHHNAISETILPNYDPNPQGVVVSISKLFEFHTCNRWKVLMLARDGDSMYVYLEPRNSSSNEEFLSQTHRNNKRVTSKLQFGTLVEVEFGYLNQVYNHDSGFSENQCYPDLIQKGEIHKRRLCIVIKAQAGRVQLVPVTSKPPRDGRDRSIVEISQESLASLTSYNDEDIQSYALCQMVKTVSSTRVLPPRTINANGRIYRDISYPFKLSSSDLKRFRSSFSHSVGFQDYYELKDKVGQLYLESKSLSGERDILASKLAETERRLDELDGVLPRFEALFEIMVDWYRGTKECTSDEARAEIEDEIDYYMQTLEIS